MAKATPATRSTENPYGAPGIVQLHAATRLFRLAFTRMLDALPAGRRVLPDIPLTRYLRLVDELLATTGIAVGCLVWIGHRRPCVPCTRAGTLVDIQFGGCRRRRRVQSPDRFGPM